MAWVHYTLFLLPVLVRRWDLNGIRLVALLLITPAPFVVSYVGAPTWALFGGASIYNWATILCLGALVADEMRGRDALPARIPA